MPSSSKSSIKTGYGKINIESEVIAQIAGLSAMDCYGVVGMASRNVKDGIVQLLRRENLSKGIHLDMHGNFLMIDLHIIVEYGTNIPAIADSLIEMVQYRVEEHTKIKVEAVNIFVEGIRVDK
jgi:uncharacterized alkaline shock family protein YloU